MKAPICEVCLKSDILCQACEKKLEEGKITQADIDISKFIFSLSEKVKSLKDVEIKKVIDSKNIIIVAKEGDGPKLVGKGGSVVKNLAKQFKKPIKIVEESNDVKKFIENLINPAKIIAINKLFTSEGVKLKIIVPARNKIYFSPEIVSDITKIILGKEVEFYFE